MPFARNSSMDRPLWSGALSFGQLQTPDAPQDAKVVDLMERLRKSLGAAGRAGSRATARPKTTAGRSKTTTKSRRSKTGRVTGSSMASDRTCIHPRAGAFTNYPNPCDPRNSGRTRSYSRCNRPKGPMLIFTSSLTGIS
jgi:hypothetical protein